MKNNFFGLFIIGFLWSMHISAQCINNITTDPDNPVNDQVPAKKNTFFDWRKSVFLVNDPQFGSGIYSPFYQSDNTLVNHFVTNHEYNPSDGWELLKYDFGLNEDGTLKPQIVSTVYLMLYNKYTGIVRIFFATDHNDGYNGASVSLSMKGSVAPSLLNDANELRAVDNFKEAQPASPSRFLNNAGMWLYADFYMNYDPCTCQNETKLFTDFSLITNSKINLSGKLTGTITSIENNKGTVNEDRYSFSNLDPANPKKAYATYKDMSDLSTKALSIASNNPTIGAAIDKLSNAIKSNRFVKAGLKATPYIGTAMELFDLFTGGGKNAGPQEVKVMPMAINAEFTLSGSITTTYPFGSITMVTPGSANKNYTASEYPYYNEVLGTFNLLETPTYKAIVVPSQTICQPQTFPRNCITYPGYTYYRMAEHLRFTVNPAARMDIQEMQMQVLVKQGRSKKTDSTVWSSPMLPITAIKDFNLQGIKGNPDPKIYVKLFVNFRRKDAGPDTQNVLFVATYQAATSKPGTFTGWSDNYVIGYDQTDLLTYPGQIILNTDQSLNTTKGAMNDIFIQQGQQVTGYTTKLEKTDHGWITVSVPLYGPKNITITSTSKGKLIANNSVVIQPGAAISAGITLAIGLPNGNPNITPVPQSDAIIQSFCKSSAYNLPIRSLKPEKDAVDGQKQSAIINTDGLKERAPETSAYPNPSIGIVTFRYSLAETSQAQLTLLDINGQLIDTVVSDYQQAGAHEASYDLSALPNGIYIYTLETSKGKETRRIVVIR